MHMRVLKTASQTWGYLDDIEYLSNPLGKGPQDQLLGALQAKTPNVSVPDICAPLHERRSLPARIDPARMPMYDS